MCIRDRSPTSHCQLPLRPLPAPLHSRLRAPEALEHRVRVAASATATATATAGCPRARVPAPPSPPPWGSCPRLCRALAGRRRGGAVSR
eukprot:8535050-Alexandrium_andersonii.AAC.1